MRGMTGEQLRASILQMAMQGKLVEQREEEGAVSISNNKKTEDIDFDIPATWRIAHLESIVESVASKQYQIKESQVSSSGKYFVISQSKEYSIGYCDDTSKLYRHNHPVIVFGDHTTEVKYVDFDFVVGADGIKIFNPKIRIIEPKLLYYQLIFYTHGLNKIGGYSRHYKFIKNKPFVIPPLAEQKRIVARIEELMPLVEQYSDKSEKLNTLNTSFPEMMKKSILQEAVHGRLVSQDPNDEPASVLLKKIAVEKKRLVREGKIKKQKPLPDITEAEVPFEVPEGWEWVRLEKITKSISDGDHQPPPKAQNGIPFLVISNVSDGNLNFSDTRYVSEEYYNALSDDRKAENGDVLFTVTGSYGIPVKVNTIRQFCFQRHIALIKPLMDADYLAMILDSPLIKKQCDTTATGTAQKTVGLGALRNFLIPLPPVEEQKRILERLHEIKSTKGIPVTVN